MVGQGTKYNHANLLGLTQEGEGSITDIADYESASPSAVVQASEGFATVYYGGPTRGWKDTPNTINGTVVATYVGTFNGKKALMAGVVSADGKLLLTSAHFEAWEDIGIQGWVWDGCWFVLFGTPPSVGSLHGFSRTTFPLHIC